MEEKRDLSLLSFICLGVGSVIGSGVFAMPAVMGGVAGPGLILATFLTGLFTLFPALSYAELASAFPISGGPYSLPRKAFGDLAGFLIGWGYFACLFIGTAAVIDIFVLYLGFYFPVLINGETLSFYGMLTAIATVWVFTLMNIIGVKWGGYYGIITTIGKLIPLMVFALVGLKFQKLPNFTPFFPFGFGGMALSISLVFWSYLGIEGMVVVSSEVKNPSKNIPLGIIWSMILIVFFYLIVAAVFVGMLDFKALNISSWKDVGQLPFPLADVFLAVKRPYMAVLMTLGAIIATAGAAGSWILIQGRMPFSMAKDQLFFSGFKKLSPRFHTPVRGLVFTSILTSLVIILIPNFPSVALMASITAVIPYAAALLALPVLRKKMPDKERPFRLKAHKTFTCIGFILMSFLIYWASWPWTFVGMILIIISFPFYFIFHKNKPHYKGVIWFFVYLLGIVIVSLLGDPKYSFQNFTPIEPLNLLVFPWDLTVLSMFSIMIYLSVVYSKKL